MPRDAVLLFSTRILRLFGYGFVSVVFALYLAEIGFTESQTGLLLTFALAGDAVISLLITTQADRIGRKRMLMLGALLVAGTGIVFAISRDFLVLTLTAVLGVLSPSGGEIGPFLSLEQSALTQTVGDNRRTRVFAWYNLAGSFSTALGALFGGALPQVLQSMGFSAPDSFRAVLIGYAGIGFVLLALFSFLSPAAEVQKPAQVSGSRIGLHRSGGIVLRLSALFAMDAFAGGFIVQSLLAYWFHLRFGMDSAVLGALFFGANILAGISALSAARIAARFGLINTMVFTHIPSNVLLILVPLMPTAWLAAGLLLIRYSISQMDVPTRQSYTMAVVTPEERSAAAGITTIARSVGAAVSPSLSGQLMAVAATMSFPFFLAGGLKI
ncbi:MAG TPA: MFS transporter, partial [Acidobacteriota bacterium]|nr:MFS transporter [Acidobacteriota bacterium]